MGQLLAERDDLVDLLLVLRHDHGHLGVIPNERELLGDRVLVDGHRDAAQALRRELRRVETRTVVADDRELVSTLEPERGQPQREVAHVPFVLGPRPRLPDATILLPHGGTPGKFTGVAQQETGKRRRISHAGPRSLWSRRGTLSPRPG